MPIPIRIVLELDRATGIILLVENITSIGAIVFELRDRTRRHTDRHTYPNHSKCIILALLSESEGNWHADGSDVVAYPRLKTVQVAGRRTKRQRVTWWQPYLGPGCLDFYRDRSFVPSFGSFGLMRIFELVPDGWRRCVHISAVNARLPTV